MLCKYASDTTSMRSPCSRGAPLARRESESESLDDIPTTISNSQRQSHWIPHMTGVLRSRHLKNMPKALSWLSNWQVNEFVLRDTWFGWHRWKLVNKRIAQNGWTGQTVSRFAQPQVNGVKQSGLTIVILCFLSLSWL